MRNSFLTKLKHKRKGNRRNNRAKAILNAHFFEYVHFLCVYFAHLALFDFGVQVLSQTYNLVKQTQCSFLRILIHNIELETVFHMRQQISLSAMINQCLWYNPASTHTDMQFTMNVEWSLYRAHTHSKIADNGKNNHNMGNIIRILK